MAAVGSAVLTLLDHAKRSDPDGKTAKIVELLSQTNQILDDMLWKEGNLPTGERCTVRTGLPTVAWRLLNAGVTPSKSTTAQIDEQCGKMEAWSEVDVALANLNGNVGSFRLTEAQAFVESMNQEMAQTIFLGNSGTAPEEFTGLNTRYSSTTAGNGQNVLLGGGAGSDNSSIYLVYWGAHSVYGIFPKGSKAGLQHKNWGEQVCENTAGVGGSRLAVYRDQWTWDCGIALRDWRYVVRIANIDISNLVAQSSAADLFNLMIKASHRVPNPGMGRPAFYMNRSCFQMLDIQARDAVGAGGQLSYAEVAGKRIATFRGIPVRICDALTETEATVS